MLEWAGTAAAAQAAPIVRDLLRLLVGALRNLGGLLGEHGLAPLFLGLVVGRLLSLHVDFLLLLRLQFLHHLSRYISFSSAPNRNWYVDGLDNEYSLLDHGCAICGCFVAGHAIKLLRRDDLVRHGALVVDLGHHVDQGARGVLRRLGVLFRHVVLVASGAVRAIKVVRPNRDLLPVKARIIHFISAA